MRADPVPMRCSRLMRPPILSGFLVAEVREQSRSAPVSSTVTRPRLPAPDDIRLQPFLRRCRLLLCLKRETGTKP